MGDEPATKRPSSQRNNEFELADSIIKILDERVRNGALDDAMRERYGVAISNGRW